MEGTEPYGSVGHGPVTSLSHRALSNIVPNEMKKIMTAGSTNTYDPSHNPKGVISLGVAENRLMHQEIVDHINTNLYATKKMLTYGDGSIGSDELRQAVASFMNETNFRPHQALIADDISILNGVSAIIDCLAFCLCEEGEGILLGRPTYVGFISDVVNRSKVKPVMVSFGDTDPMSLEAVKCYERALLESALNGTHVRALLLCHPHNPFGRYYDPPILEAYLSLCARHKIHLICDEVYANSRFSNVDCPEPPNFTSVLGLDYRRHIDPGFVHCLYGMSKDFCCNGIRAGAFVSQFNPKLHSVLRAVSKFAWTSSLADAAWCSLLTDKPFLNDYLKQLKERLASAYNQCVTFLKMHRIQYIQAYSSPFVWINLQQFLVNESPEAETELSWRMINSGIWLATGEAYRSERQGWYRLTFAVPAEELDLGLKRLAMVLHLKEICK